MNKTDYDANKKVKGRESHMTTDTKGTVMAADVTSAFVQDTTGARALRNDVEELRRVQKIVADPAY